MDRMINITSILKHSRIVAIIGCSNNRFRASNLAASHLLDASFTIVPVNPKYESVLGKLCYHAFSEIPDEIDIDIVNIFRRPEETAGVLSDILARMRRTGQRPTVWTQPGVSTDLARQMTLDAGLVYVEDRCIMTELEALT